MSTGELDKWAEVVQFGRTTLAQRYQRDQTEDNLCLKRPDEFKALLLQSYKSVPGPTCTKALQIQ